MTFREIVDMVSKAVSALVVILTLLLHPKVASPEARFSRKTIFCLIGLLLILLFVGVKVSLPPPSPARGGLRGEWLNPSPPPTGATTPGPKATVQEPRTSGPSWTQRPVYTGINHNFSRILTEPTPQQDSPAVVSHEAAERAPNNERLQALDISADNWRNHGTAAGRTVLAILDEIKETDKAQFTSKEQSAYSTLLQVKEQFKARDAGLSQATKSQVKILVEPATGDEKGGAVAQALSNCLHDAGFQVTRGRDDADIRVRVAFRDIEKLPDIYTSGVATAVYTAILSASAVWTADNSPLPLEPQFRGEARASGFNVETREEQAKSAALHEAIDRLVKQFTGMTAK